MELIGGGRVWEEREGGDVSAIVEVDGVADAVPGDCCMTLWRGEL